MSEPRIVPVDARDDDALDAWFATYHAADVHERPYAAPFQLAELRAGLLAEPVTAWRQAWSLRRAGEVLASGLLELPLLDNPRFAYVQVHTRPDARRRGLGSALLARLEGVAAERGRSLLHAEAHWPYDQADPAGAPGPAFLLARGFSLGLADVQRELRLPVPERLLAGLAAEAAPHHRDYHLQAWLGPCPGDLVASVAALEALVAVESPVGDLELEPDSADVEAYRRREELIAAQGRTRITAVAVDDGGEAVAYSDLVVPEHEPGRVYQWGTLVRRDHRGHRLGLAVKLATLGLVQRHFPDRTRLTTWNAEVNAPMIAVNERLGFRPVERAGQFQKRQSLRSRT